MIGVRNVAKMDWDEKGTFYRRDGADFHDDVLVPLLRSYPSSSPA